MKGMAHLYWVAGLVLFTFAASAESTMAPVKLSGIVDGFGLKFAVIKVQSAGHPAREIFLKEGQLGEGVEMRKIDSDNGTVSLDVGGRAKLIGFDGRDEEIVTNKPGHGPSVRLVSISLNTAITLYADLKSRTVLQHPELLDQAVSLECDARTKAEAAGALEKMFGEQKIATIRDGDKFIMVVPLGMTNGVTPHSPPSSETDVLTPAFSANFLGAPMGLVFQAYGDYVGKEVVNFRDVGCCPMVTFRQTTPLSKAQIIYALETQFAWLGFRLVPDGTDKLKCERIP
jgi:hypothetical protein